MAKLLISKALPCVLVTFCLLVIPTPSVADPSVAAPSVTAAVQEPLLTDELVALQEIARALNRNFEMLSNNWSWIKISLSGIVGLFVTGVTTLYLADCGRKRWRHWKDLRPPPLQDVFTPLGDQLTAALDRMATTAEYSWRQLAVYAKEVTDLRAQLVDLRAQLAAALDRMATTIADIWRQLAMYANQLADLRNQLADLRAQLAAALDRMATTTADAERKEEETKRKVEWLEERFGGGEHHQRHNLTTYIWPEMENSVEGVIPEAHALRRAAGFLSE